MSIRQRIMFALGSLLVVTVTRLQHHLGSMVSARRRFSEGDAAGEELVRQGWTVVLTESEGLRVSLTNWAQAAHSSLSQFQGERSQTSRKVAGSVGNNIQALCRQLDDFRPRLDLFHAKLSGSPSEATIYLEGDMDQALLELQASLKLQIC